MKKIRQSILTVMFLGIVHSILCVVYNYTYFSPQFKFEERFQGIVYWIVLIGSFLAGPFFYYVTGRLCNGKGSRKGILYALFAINGAITLLGIASFFSPALSGIYCLINAPSYLYFSLFSDTVMYIAVPTMVASSLFPAFFFRIGYLNKPRTNNEIKMEDIEVKEEKEL
ncbi:MAG: hypothetical protein ACI4VW_05695 [Acutalibacteraceae bacterium]